MNSSQDILQSSKPLPCPKCNKLFRLPTGFTESHSLACPHCKEQVSGSQILEALVPTATLVETPKGSGTAAARSFDEQDFVIPKPLKTAMRRRSRHPERYSSPESETDAPETNALNIDTGGTPDRSPIRESKRETKRETKRESKRESKSDRTKFPAPERRQSSKRKKKKSKDASPVGELAKIILGGILAIPIAQLVLWWAFNADPLNLAKPTAKVAEFVVPPKLRPVKVIEQPEEEKRNRDMPASQKLHDDGPPMNLNQ